MSASESERFAASLTFVEVWRATTDELDALLRALIGSLTESGVTGLQIDGNLADGNLEVAFDAPDDDEDSLVALGLVVRALNASSTLPYIHLTGFRKQGRDSF